MRPFLVAALSIAFVLAVALVALSAQSDASRALPQSSSPFIQALKEQGGGPTETPAASVTTSTMDASSPSRPPALPEPTAGSTHHAAGMIVGVATHYWNGAGYYAAAGPGLRRAIGADWRGHQIVVTAFPNGQARSVSLFITDWCLCTRTAGRIIDLSDGAFEHICGPLGLGVCRVEVQWAVQ